PQTGPTDRRRDYIASGTMDDVGSVAASGARDVDRPRGTLRFATATERDAICTALSGERWIVTVTLAIEPLFRGRLGEAIEESIERALASRAAPGPGISSAGDADAALSDQLFRARRAGAPGIAVVLGPLRAATGALSAL